MCISIVKLYRNSFFSDRKTLIATARAGNVIGGGDWSEDRLLPDVFRSIVFGDELQIRNPNSVRPWQHVLEPLYGYMLLAEKLYEGKRECADAWNFGPEDQDTRSVGDVLFEIENLWNGDVKWDLNAEKDSHETTLLRLDNTKAKKVLNWKPGLNLTSATALTVEWYQGFMEQSDLVELTKKQVTLYQKLIKSETKTA